VSGGAAGDVGPVVHLTPYPVKSMGGEDLSEAEFEPRGLVGDRRWAVRTLTARLDGPVPEVEFPAGRLTRALGDPVHPARFRANVVLDTDEAAFPETQWHGRELRLGDDVVLRLGPGMVRCRMVDLPQRGLDPDGRILEELARTHDLAFGLQATVVRAGTVRAGDAAVLL
jgi:uncharacterized protein YcbX